MFESICFRRMHGLGDPSPLDIGVLAESLLFYGRIHLVAEPDSLRHLIRQCGPETVIALMDEGFLTVAFLEQTAGIRTYDSISSELTSHEISTNLRYDLEHEAENAFRDATQSTARGHDLAQRFTALARPIGYDDGLAARFGAELDDAEYMRRAVADLLRLLAPGFDVPRDLRFDVEREASTFRVQTNIDFAAANAWYKVPADAPHLRDLDTSLLLLYLLESRADLEFASRFSAEIATSPAGASLLQLRMRDLFAARKHHEEEIIKFEELALSDGHRIREVIDSGERTYADVIALLRRAERFRSWLAGQPPSAHLAREYYRAVTAETWVDKLPGKTFRWLIFNFMGTGLGTLAEAAVGDPIGGMAAAAAVGLAVSGADTFLLNKIVHGWRPNQFVEGELLSFAGPSN